MKKGIGRVFLFLLLPAKIKMMPSQKTTAFIQTGVLLLVVMFIPLNGRAAAQAQAADEGNTAQINYEMGRSYLLQNLKEKALAYFQKSSATQGEYAYLSKLEIVRLFARPLTKGGNSVAQIRSQIDSLSDEEQKSRVWLEAALALYGHSRDDEALELMLELPLRYPQSADADDALFYSGKLLFEKRSFSGALDLFMQILQNYPNGDFADAASYWTARVYANAGLYQNRTMARGALFPFFADEPLPAYRNSIWRESALLLLREMDGSSLQNIYLSDGEENLKRGSRRENKKGE